MWLPPYSPLLLYRVRKLLKRSEMAKSLYGIGSEVQSKSAGIAENAGFMRCERVGYDGLYNDLQVICCGFEG